MRALRAFFAFCLIVFTLSMDAGIDKVVATGGNAGDGALMTLCGLLILFCLLVVVFADN